MKFNFIKFAGQGKRNFGTFLTVGDRTVWINKGATELTKGITWVDLYIDEKNNALLLKKGKDFHILINEIHKNSIISLTSHLKKGRYWYKGEEDGGFIFQQKLCQVK